MLEASISKVESDPEWDDFLETRPDGCYQQSSLWAKLKARDGWQYARLVVRKSNQIVGGAQALLKHLPRFGYVGYVSKGPVVAYEDPELEEYVLDQLKRLAREERILFLRIQPPHSAGQIAQRLFERGALPSQVSVTPLVTARVDIRPEPEAVLARMPKKRRSNIRRAERKGVTVRVGAEEDLKIFNNLRKIHGKRRRYRTGPADYFESLWSIFASREKACLLVAEYEGEALAARMNVAFGDVVFASFVADSGNLVELNAQSLMHWKAMLWGKERGCSWYDLGGIDKEVEGYVINGLPIPETAPGRRAKFKLSFGSQVVVRPGVCDVSYVWPRRLTGRLVPILMRMGPLLGYVMGGSMARRLQVWDRIARQAAVDFDRESY